MSILTYDAKRQEREKQSAENAAVSFQKWLARPETKLLLSMVPQADAAIADERPEWEDPRTPGQIEADLRAAMCEVRETYYPPEFPRENPELDSPWWLVAAAVVVVLTCAASAIWPMGWAT